MGRPVRCLPSDPFIKYVVPPTTTSTTTLAPGEKLRQYIIIPQSGVACPNDGRCDIKITDRTCDLVIEEINLFTPTQPNNTTTTISPIITSTTTTTTSGPFVYPGNIVSTNAIYSQSSVYHQNQPATALTMNNKTHVEEFQTGTDYLGLQWIRMDLGSVFNVKTIVIGCDFNNVLRFGWGKSYTENLPIQSSTDGSIWTTIGNTGLFFEPMKLFPVNINARYIRITNIIVDGYIAATEFAAGT